MSTLTSVTLKSVRRLIAVVLVGGCSFEHGVLAPGDGGGSGSVDASGVASDAAVIDAAIDARPIDPPCEDADEDGVCNDIDDWPCGAKPSDPGATIAFSNNNGATNTTITGVSLDGGRLVVASPQEMLSLMLTYEIDDKACAQACIDQIEVGWVPGGRAGCVFDDEVPKQNGVDGTVSVMIRAPMTRQVYDLRVNLGQNYSCNYGGANGWWGGTTPAPTRTIAKLCVH